MIKLYLNFIFFIKQYNSILQKVIKQDKNINNTFKSCVGSPTLCFVLLYAVQLRNMFLELC